MRKWIVSKSSLLLGKMGVMLDREAVKQRRAGSCCGKGTPCREYQCACHPDTSATYTLGGYWWHFCVASHFMMWGAEWTKSEPVERSPAGWHWVTGVVACLLPRRLKLTKSNLPDPIWCFLWPFGMWFRRILFCNLEQHSSEVAGGERYLLLFTI